MNRSNSIALGLSALVLGAVASTIPSSTMTSRNNRSVPPSIARRAFAAKDGVKVHSAPSESAPVEGTFGIGSAFLVGPEAIPGWFPIVREWVEGNQRFTRDLAYIYATDITFTDPTFADPRRTAAFAASDTPNRPIGAAPLLGRTDGGECDLFVKVTWPHGVDDFKARLDTLFSATDRTVRDCAGLAIAQRDQWAVFLTQWKKFAATPTPTFGSGGDWDTVCAYSRTLDGWRDVLAKTECAVVGPTSIHGYEVPTSVENSLGSIATIVKWGALVTGGALLIATFYPEIRSARAALTKAQTGRGHSKAG